jgi:hypothetical protein
MKVLVQSALRTYTGAPHVEASGDTLLGLFADAGHRCPGLRFRAVDEQQQLRPNMRIFVNGLGVRDLGQALRPEDFVPIVLALSGGLRADTRRRAQSFALGQSNPTSQEPQLSLGVFWALQPPMPTPSLTKNSAPRGCRHSRATAPQRSH